MAGYGDPELLVAQWIEDTLNIPCRADPNLRPEWWADAPMAHVQRGQGLGQVPLSLDDATLDVDVYSHDADHARDAAHRIWMAVLTQLPKTTFLSGIFVTGAFCLSAPAWAPDPTSFRRSAAYRVILHGFTA